jgi:sigma-E factor negative regulatory protein RseC
VIEETGLVTAVSGDLAEVECERRSACGSCSANGACGTSLLERVFGRRQQILAVSNPVGAVLGDRVIVGIPEAAMLEAAFAAYLVPLVAMMAGGVCAEWLAGHLLPGWADGISVLGGLLGLAAGIWWLAGFSNRRRSDERYRAVILRRSPGSSIPVSMDGLTPGGGMEETRGKST